METRRAASRASSHFDGFITAAGKRVRRARRRQSVMDRARPNNRGGVRVRGENGQHYA